MITSDLTPDAPRTYRPRMSDPDPSFQIVLDALDAGDQDAARAIYERFVDRLVALAARKLDRRLGAKVDPESVAQSAFESFFKRRGRGEYQLRDWGMVYGLLSHIAFRKCLNRNRDQRRLRRDASRDVAFEDWQAADRGPGPEDEAAMDELLEKALSGCDPDQRAMIDAFLGGADAETVARRVGLSTRTVQRTLERFRGRLEALVGAE
ncbi:RNA polymerase sigma factor [Paludisphaera soli]|uniref:RNA polymerase sigma factor n=1 Tax=Paludisphaera soli TaxID=2712865 RepID=UPI0013E9C81A|nr:sigma-70 family RNA polymerase sigma factor [Paludisphaera soli]